MDDKELLERIEALGADEIDALPVGVITLDLQGKIRRYNRLEAELARLDQKSQLGKDFFLDVAPCTANPDFQGRFTELVAKPSGVINFDYIFRFSWGHQRVHITFVRKAGRDDVDVLVTRVSA
ncbi:MAG TPA: PAS domain-containing protein [Candidatus Dormibacteraeota bacterium]|nr:PAS domain-containing protein [Candidatus Dormibacteraeota bacterium]